MQQIDQLTERFPNMSHLSRLSLAVAATIFGVTAYAAVPAKANWLTTFTRTSIGSHVVGNPKAVRVVEYGSYTCSHCAHFEAVDAPLVKQQLVATGKISFEFRNLLRDPVDLTIAMLARCGSPSRFFGNHKYFMATQKSWMANTGNISATTNAFLAKEDFKNYMLGAFTEMKLANVVKARGISVAQARACLSDPAALKQVIGMSDEATMKMNLNSTPTFMVDGKINHQVYDLATLKSALP